MNLNDLMEVWRLQDTASIRGLNETLLRLAVREDLAKQRSQRRAEKWTAYLMSAVLVAVMVLAFVWMLRSQNNALSAWDYVVTVVGAVAALLWPSALRVSHRAQLRREQDYGESLRDQLTRHIAQLDYHATRINSPAFHLAMNLPATVWSLAFMFAIYRINVGPASRHWSDPTVLSIYIGSLVITAMLVAGSIWMQRRWLQRELLPHKRQLEALLNELDDQ